MGQPTKISREGRAAELRERIAAIEAAIAKTRGARRRAMQKRANAARARLCQILEILGREKMREVHDETAIASPGIGWKLVARRAFSTATERYPVGAEVPVNALGRNFRALLAAHYVEFLPPGTAITVQPRKLPLPAAAAKPNPKAEIIHDGDPIISWRKSLTSMASKCEGNSAQAKDLLLLTESGSELYRRAARIHADRGNLVESL